MTREDYETTNVEAAARYAMEEAWPEPVDHDEPVVLSPAAMEWLRGLGRVARDNREGDE